MAQANALIEKDIFFHILNLMRMTGFRQLFKMNSVNFAANLF
ncbi:hypothetical protein FB99_17760 [Pantoea agglomerans]|nr:hypothetical protein FB99_17760 [Pantoea agglomerans]